MAFIRDQFSKNAPKDNEEPQQSAGLSIGGASSVASSAPQQGNSSPGQQKSSSSGRFTNIQSYINANKDNQLGTAISGKVNKEADTVRKDIGAASTEASNTGKAIEEAGKAIVDKPQDVGAITTGYQYKAPEIDVSKATAGVSNIQSTTGMTGTEAGRFGLLQKYLGRPTYTQGQTRLDNLLLGSNQQALSDIKNIGSDVGNQATQLQSNVNQLQTKTASLRKLAEDTGNTYYSQLADQSAAEAKAWQDAEKAAQNNLQGVAPGSITASNVVVQGKEYNPDFVLDELKQDFTFDTSTLTPQQLKDLGYIRTTAGGSGYGANQFSDANKLGQFNQLAKLFGKTEGSQVKQSDLEHSSNYGTTNKFKENLNNVLSAGSYISVADTPDWIKNDPYLNQKMKQGATLRDVIGWATRKGDQATVDSLKNIAIQRVNSPDGRYRS